MSRPKAPKSTENGAGAKILPFRKPSPAPGLPFVEIWTDGGCEPNPGRGGYGAILTCKGHEREIAGTERGTTNNRMEIMAAIVALEALKRPCAVRLYTDSAYLKNSATLWLPKWLATNFKKGKIKNADLWLRLEKAAKPHAVDWQWIKGHNGDVMAHSLSEEARHENTAPALARARAGQ
jgi:ribonuclease HI